MAKNNNEKPNLNKSIFNSLSKLRTNNKNISKSIYGMNPEISNSVDTDIKDVQDILTNIIHKKNDITNNDFIGALNALFKKKNDNSPYKDIKDLFEKDLNESVVQSMMQDMNNHVLQHADLELLFTLLPQISEAIDAIRDSILSPDDFSAIMLLNTILLNDDIDDSKNRVYKDKLNNVLKEYDFEKIIKKTTRDALIHGNHHIAVIPYKTAYKRIVEKQNKEKEKSKPPFNESNKNLNESYIQICDTKFLTETKNSMNKHKINVNDDELMDGMLDIINDGIILQEGLSSFVDIKEAYYLEENISKRKNKMDKYKVNKINKAPIASISGDGVLDTEKKSKEEFEIKGCKIQHLNIEKLIPVSMGDLKLGYYYIEQSDKAKVKNNLIFNRNNINKLMQNDNDTLEKIYDKLSQLVVKKMDSQFVKDNLRFKEQIFEIIKATDMAQQDIKVTFLEESEVIKFSVNEGVSVLKNVLFFAKMLLNLYISAVVQKIERGNDVRCFYVKPGIGTHNGGQINATINDFKLNRKSLSTVNNINVGLRNFSRWNDLFITTNDNGDKPFDIDVIQGQDVNLRDDFLEQLEEIVISGLGIPIQLLKQSKEVDFSRSLTLYSGKFTKTNTSRQMDLNPSVTDLARAILYTEMSEEDYSKIDNTELSFQTSKTNSLDTLNSLISSTLSLGESIANTVVAEDHSKRDELTRLIKLDVLNEYVPNLNMQKYLEIIKKGEVNSVSIEKDSNDDDNY